MFEQEGMPQLQAVLSTPKNIVITTHRKPDGDAMGSMLAMYLYLKKKHHHVTAISPTDYPDFLAWMPSHKDVLRYDTQEITCRKAIDKADLVICLDFNKLYRLEKLGDVIAASKADKVCIDHHLEPDDFARYRYIHTKACSTCELVYEFIKLMEDENYLDTDIATCIYTGIMTDTDNFRIPTTSHKVFLIAADLVEHGVLPSFVYDKVFLSFTHSRLSFFGYVISERLEVLPEYHTAIISLDADDLKKFKIGTGDTEGVVNLPMQIADVRLTIMIVQRKDEVKISMRSKGNINVNDICRQHFNGGGHANASGGSSSRNVAETVTFAKSLLPQYKTILNA